MIRDGTIMMPVLTRDSDCHDCRRFAAPRAGGPGSESGGETGPGIMIGAVTRTVSPARRRRRFQVFAGESGTVKIMIIPSQVYRDHDEPLCSVFKFSRDRRSLLELRLAGPRKNLKTVTAEGDRIFKFLFGEFRLRLRRLGLGVRRRDRLGLAAGSPTRSPQSVSPGLRLSP